MVKQHEEWVEARNEESRRQEHEAQLAEDARQAEKHDTDVVVSGDGEEPAPEPYDGLDQRPAKRQKKRPPKKLRNRIAQAK